MDASSTLHLALPAVHTIAMGASAPVFQLAQPRAFTTSVNPLVFFSVLDHYLRRNAGQDRVIGTLLGVRSEDGSEVEIRSCYPVPHLETEDQVKHSPLQSGRARVTEKYAKGENEPMDTRHIRIIGTRKIELNCYLLTR